MNVKNNQRSRLTRMLLKNSYLRLMSEKPSGKITVKEICQGAEVNRSTFYLYYSEPNDLLMELEDDTLSHLSEWLNSIGALHQANDTAAAYLLEFLSYIRRNDELIRALLVENSDPHFRRKLQAQALEIVQKAFDITLPEDTREKTFLFLISGSIELLIDWIKSGYACSERELCRLLYGLCEACLARS